MLKKIIIVISGIIILAGGAFLLFLNIHGSNNAFPVPPGQNPQGNLPAVSATTSASNVVSGVPQGATFGIGTPQGIVMVKNFYTLPFVIDEEFLILEDTNDYQITYDTEGGQFFIYASSSPLDAARAEGESAFLTMLGISKSDGCKLNVAEGYPEDSPRANDHPGLSFCAPGAFNQ